MRPRVHSTDVAVERRVSNDITVTVSYLNSRGRNLPYFRDINFAPANSTVDYVLEGGGSLGTLPALPRHSSQTPASAASP